MKLSLSPSLRPVLAAASSAALLFPSALSAADLMWDANLEEAGAQDGDGTWTASSINFWNAVDSVNETPVKGEDNLVIGNTEGGSTITINNGGALLNFSDDVSNSNLNFNRGYELAGTAAGDGLSIGNMSIFNASTVTISARIDGGQTTGAGVVSTRNWNVQSGSTLNLTGGGRMQGMSNNSAVASTVNITAGTWSIGGFNADGSQSNNANVGGGGSEARVLTVNHEAGATFETVAGNLNVGGNASNNAATLTTYNLNGSFTASGAQSFSMGGGSSGTAGALSRSILNIGSTGAVTTTGEIRVGNDGGSGEFNINGGTFTTTNKMVLARRGNTGGAITATTNINSGLLRVGQIQFGDTQSNFQTGSTATLNVRGGILEITSNVENQGIFVGGSNPNLTTTINLSGGTIRSVGNWSSAMAMNLSNADGGITIQTSDALNAGKTVALNGALSGDGGLTKTGAGSLALNAANTYTGLTQVNEGTLVLGSFSSISDLGSIGFESDALISLNFASGSETIAALFNTTTGTFAEPGTYTAEALNDIFGGSNFSSLGGTLTVTAVPEPGTIALLALGGVGALILRRRRRA